MIEQSLAREPRTQQARDTGEEQGERMFRAFMEGAESGMIEARGYGLTAEERVSAEREAFALYIEAGVG